MILLEGSETITGVVRVYMALSRVGNGVCVLVFLMLCLRARIITLVFRPRILSIGISRRSF